MFDSLDVVEMSDVFVITMTEYGLKKMLGGLKEGLGMNLIGRLLNKPKITATDYAI